MTGEDGEEFAATNARPVRGRADPDACRDLNTSGLGGIVLAEHSA